MPRGLFPIYLLLTRLSVLLLVAGLLFGFSGKLAKAGCDFSPATVKVGGGEIHYDRAGAGQSVILLHGLFAQKEQWPVICRFMALEPASRSLSAAPHGDPATGSQPDAARSGMPQAHDYGINGF